MPAVGNRSEPLIRLLGLLLAMAFPIGASAQTPSIVVRFPLKQVELTIAADSIAGIHLLVLPSTATREGKQQQGLIWLRFDPDSVLEWLNRAATVLRIYASNGPDKGIQWSPAISALPSGAISFGRTRKKGILDKAHWLAVGDSTAGWQVELTASEADSVIRTLLMVSSRSRLDTSAGMPRNREGVDVPAIPLESPPPRFTGRFGTVAAQFVVGPDGLAEPESFEALVASDPALIAGAWEVLRRARYRPATRGGRPVRQLMNQVIVWRDRP